jgi:hypothetical protein
MKSYIFSGVVAAFASLAAAYTTPTNGPEGNAIYTPTLNEQVPVGSPYTITWDVSDSPCAAGCVRKR